MIPIQTRSASEELGGLPRWRSGASGWYYQTQQPPFGRKGLESGDFGKLGGMEAMRRLPDWISDRVNHRPIYPQSDGIRMLLMPHSVELSYLSSLAVLAQEPEEAVKTWDWLRASDAKALVMDLDARCLSQFLHILEVS